MPKNLVTTLLVNGEPIADWKGHGALYSYVERDQSKDGWEDRELYVDYPPDPKMNGKAIKLSENDLDSLLIDVKHGMLPVMGTPAFEGDYIDPEDTVDEDVKIIAKAIEAAQNGAKVTIKSTWK